MEQVQWLAGQKGIAARITSLYPKALYTHCAAHRLNRCVVKCCDIWVVSNMMQTANAVARFFSNSPKRQLALETCVDNIFQDEKRKKLKEMCRTRWVERHEAFQIFSDLFLPTVSCLETITNASTADWDRESQSDAQSLPLSTLRFSFIVALVATQGSGIHKEPECKATRPIC